MASEIARTILGVDCCQENTLTPMAVWDPDTVDVSLVELLTLDVPTTKRFSCNGTLARSSGLLYKGLVQGLCERQHHCRATPTGVTNSAQ